MTRNEFRGETVGARVPSVGRGSRHGGLSDLLGFGASSNAIRGREPRLPALASRYSGAARTVWTSPRTFVVGASGCRPLAP
jgi:hypothetical protein